MGVRDLSQKVVEIINPHVSSQSGFSDEGVHLAGTSVSVAEVKERYKTYLISHYLGLHITVVGVTLAVAGVAAASLMSQPNDAYPHLITLWVLWVGSLAAMAVAYGGPMVGAFALPASIPSVSDLLLPILIGAVETLLFTVLIHQVTGQGLAGTVNVWLLLVAIFSALAELAVLRARWHYAAGIANGAYSTDLTEIIRVYLLFIRRDAVAAVVVATISILGFLLRVSDAVKLPDLTFPVPITALLILGLRGHAETSKMWRQLLSQHEGPQPSATDGQEANTARDNPTGDSEADSGMLHMD